jgi:hypothetical protein
LHEGKKSHMLAPAFRADGKTIIVSGRINMEDVRCPGCGGMIPFPEGKLPVCPRCGQGIEVIDGGGGMWIMGLRQPPPQSVLTEPHEDDPLVRKYAQWKGGGIIMLSLGPACFLMILIDLWTSYFGGAFYFGREHFILAGLGIVLALAGGILFLAGWAFKKDRLRILDNNSE